MDKPLKKRVTSLLVDLLEPFHVPDLDENRFAEMSGHEEAKLRFVDLCARVHRRASWVLSVAFALSLIGWLIPDGFEAWIILSVLGLFTLMSMTLSASGMICLRQQGRKLGDQQTGPSNDDHSEHNHKNQGGNCSQEQIDK